jgi:hypothetical protein
VDSDRVIRIRLPLQAPWPSFRPFLSKKDALMFYTLLDHSSDVATPVMAKPATAIARWGSAAARLLGLAIVAALGCGSTLAWADWDVGDPYKMHFPQLPDPNGWDINITGTGNLVADDWQCTQTGPVSDIHFWYSVQGDDLGTSINSVTATIYGDIPVSGTVPFSRPGSLLWSGTFGVGAFQSRFSGTGTQGFASPQEGTPGWVRPDHIVFNQTNITGIADPFVQTAGTIYWLGLSVQVTGTSLIGWKTSLDAFQDDSTFLGTNGLWNELVKPEIFGGQSLHQAFVITPEPTTVALVSIGGLTGAGAFVRRAQRRRRR